MNRPLTIAILDDHSITVDGYRARLAQDPTLRIVWTTAFGEDVLTCMDEQPVDVLILDVSVPASATNPNPYPILDVIPRLLDEANSIAQSCYPNVKRVTRTGPAPNHKPSILQDYELGRAMEIDALVRAPAAFARQAGLATPMMDLMGALAIQRARDKGLYAP